MSLAREENVEVEVAMQYNHRIYQENIFLTSTNINTREGGYPRGRIQEGHHPSFFKQYGEDNGLFTKAKVSVSGDDFREGLTAIVSVKVPSQLGQNQGELATLKLQACIRVCGRCNLSFLEENPGHAKNHRQGDIGGNGQTCGRKSQRSWYSLRPYSRVEVCQVSCRLFVKKILRPVRSSW